MPWPRGRLHTEAEKAQRHRTRHGFHTLPPETLRAITQAGGRASVQGRWHYRRRDTKGRYA